MRQDELWDEMAAATYDSIDEGGMFDPGLLDRTTAFLAELARGGRALEFAVGTGRVAIPLVRRGVAVTGIELSQPMIDRLREKADEDALPVVQGDMATTRVPGEFTLVYLVFNTISTLLTQAEQVACFRNAAAHLAPGGRFVIELGVPQLRRLPPGVPAVVFTSELGYLGVDTYDTVEQLLVSHHVHYGEGREARHSVMPQRYIWPAELDLMGQLAGFEREARYADWDRSPFTEESGSHVSVYRLPG
jgi:SAM-dependent methyltransferase